MIGRRHAALIGEGQCAIGVFVPRDGIGQRRQIGLGFWGDYERFAVEPSKQIGGTVADNHLAVVDDGDVVAHFFCFFEIVCCQNDRHAAFVQFAHVLPQHIAQFDIDACGGFIQYEDLWRMHQCFAQEQPAPHAAGQRPCICVCLVCQPNEFKNFCSLALLFGNAIKSCLHIQ